jgi:hypothetical protein
MAIAQFPDFSFYDFSLKDEYNAIYKEHLPYSDFSFGNLGIWLNQYQDLQISLLNENIVIECRNLFEDGAHILSVLGNNEMDTTFAILFDYLKASGQPSRIDLVPETTIFALKNPEKYRVDLERDNANYILSTENFVSLEGSVNGRLRRQIRGFEREYGNRLSVKEFDLTKEENIRSVINHAHLWDKIYTYNDQEKQESYVINTSLRHAKELEMRNLSLLVDDRIQAIAIYQEIPQNEYVIGNHTKSNHQYRNSFNYLLYALSQELLKRGVRYINFEQDLGIAGIREHKLGLRPVSFLNHYSVVMPS